MYLADLRRSVAQGQFEQHLLLFSKLVLTLGRRKDVTWNAFQVILVDQGDLVEKRQRLHAALQASLPLLVARALQIIVQGQAAEEGLTCPLEEGQFERHVVGNVCDLVDRLVQRDAQRLGHHRTEHDQQRDRRGRNKEKKNAQADAALVRRDTLRILHRPYAGPDPIDGLQDAAGNDRLDQEYRQVSEGCIKCRAYCR